MTAEKGTGYMNIWTTIRSIFSNKKHRTFAILCALALLVLTVANIGMVRNVKTGAPPVVSHETPLPTGTVFTQEIDASGITMRNLYISFVNHDLSVTGDLSVSLFENESLVQSWEVKTNTLKSADRGFALSDPLELKDASVYTFTVSVSTETDSPIGVQMTADLTGRGMSKLGDRVLYDRAAAYYLSYQDEGSYLLDFLHILLNIGLAIVFLAAAYILIYSKLRTEVIVTLFVFVLGMFYMVTITPCSPPDEPHHYHSAYQLSNAFLFCFDRMEYGKASDFDFHNFVVHQNVSSGYLRTFSELGEASGGDATEIDIPLPRKLSYFVEYIPQAMGIALGRALGRNVVTVYMLGRLFNLMFYCVCVYFALKKLSRFKLQMGLIAMLPMALHQAASLSYDAFVNGMAFLLIAHILELIYSTEMVKTRDMVTIGLIGALLAPGKVIYCPILLMLFFIPRERFGTMKRKLLLIAAVGLVCVIMIGAFQLPSMMEIGTRGESKLNFEGQYTYTFSYLLQNPLHSAKIFFSSFVNYGYEWLMQGLGFRLSGLTLLVPTWVMAGTLILLVLSAITGTDDSPVLKRRDRIFTALITTGLILLVMLSMFLAWTSNTSPLIQGVQGRYFIPVFPLLLLCLCGNKTFCLQRNMDRQMLMIMLCLNILCLTSVIDYTVVH